MSNAVVIRSMRFDDILDVPIADDLKLQTLGFHIGSLSTALTLAPPPLRLAWLLAMVRSEALATSAALGAPGDKAQFLRCLTPQLSALLSSSEFSNRVFGSDLVWSFQNVWTKSRGGRPELDRLQEILIGRKDTLIRSRRQLPIELALDWYSALLESEFVPSSRSQASVSVAYTRIGRALFNLFKLLRTETKEPGDIVEILALFGPILERIALPSPLKPSVALPNRLWPPVVAVATHLDPVLHKMEAVVKEEKPQHREIAAWDLLWRGILERSCDQGLERFHRIATIYGTWLDHKALDLFDAFARLPRNDTAGVARSLGLSDSQARRRLRRLQQETQGISDIQEARIARLEQGKAGPHVGKFQVWRADGLAW